MQRFIGGLHVDLVMERELCSIVCIVVVKMLNVVIEIIVRVSVGNSLVVLFNYVIHASIKENKNSHLKITLISCRLFCKYPYTEVYSTF